MKTAAKAARKAVGKPPSVDTSEVRPVLTRPAKGGGSPPREPQLALPEGGWREIPADPPVKTLKEAVERGLIDDERGAELVNGRVILFDPPTAAHEEAKSFLLAILDHADRSDRPPGGRPGQWLIGVEVRRVYLDRTIRESDLAGWWIPEGFRSTREARAMVETMYPDWICEVLSPSTFRDDLGPRAAAYVGAGVSWYWVVDPEALRVVVFGREEGLYVEQTRIQGAARVALPPFDVELNLLRVWGGETEPGKAIVRIPDTLPVPTYLKAFRIHGRR